MAIRRRTTEQHPHPIWERLIEEYNIVEIEGFIFECTDDELIAATKSGEPTIPIHCLEAVECDSQDEFQYLNFFSEEEWKKKVQAAQFFGSKMKLISHIPGDQHLFKVHEVEIKDGQLNFAEVERFEKEPEFIEWWKTIKKLRQSKGQVEAAPRQRLTIIDGVIERNGLQWGGNIDGFVLTNESNQVLAIIELRQSRRQKVEKYDPADWFLGSLNKGGDFKTWLPMIYLKKAYKVPLILITVSTLDESKLGYTQVFGINHKQLFYEGDVSPRENVTDNFEQFKAWLDAIIKKNNDGKA